MKVRREINLGDLSVFIDDKTPVHNPTLAKKL